MSLKHPLDEAFNWLVVILGIIAGALCQFPELWPLGGPESPREMTVGLVRLLIFPVIVLVFVWLWSYLARETENQVVLKSLSWILASIMLVADIVLLLLGIYRPVIPGGGGPEATLPGLAVGFLILLSPLYLSPFFCFFVVRSRMREIYKDSKFLHSLPRQVLLYIFAVLLFFLASGILEELVGDILAG